MGIFGAEKHAFRGSSVSSIEVDQQPSFWLSSNAGITIGFIKPIHPDVSFPTAFATLGLFCFCFCRGDHRLDQCFPEVCYAILARIFADLITS